MNSDSFSIKSTNCAFSQRQKDVFDQLKVLENNRKNLGSQTDRLMETDQAPPIRRNQRSVTKHFRGKDSIFKQPQDRAPRNFIRGIPDFKKNPHKWTKYSLSDVKDEDISDKGNTNAALSFLKEMEHRKSLEIQDETSDDLKVITFNKPKSFSAKLRIDDDSKPSFRSSKVIMPEYIVGQRVRKNKSRTTESLSQMGTSKELKLDHLMENPDDE